jgi:preprotein translocase subunit SecE
VNREMKRLMQRQGQVEADGSPAARRPTQPTTKPRPQAQQEISAPGRVAEFAREVRSELKQVAWPTRSEVVNSSTVVLITLVLLVCLIFGLNFAFSHAVINLFHVPGT